MRTQFSKIVFLAGIALALAFTFSCSSGGGGGDSTQLSSSSDSWLRKSSSSAVNSSSSVPSSSSNGSCSSVGNSSSFSSVQSSSSNGSSSSSVTYRLDCSGVPETTGSAGVAITPPTVTCYENYSDSPTSVISGLDWTNAPNWSNPAAGTYGNISVLASSGNCSGKTATCWISGGILRIDKGNNIANYRTVKIGEQVWMAENLDYHVSHVGNISCDNYKMESYCDKYGLLYSWATAMDLPYTCDESSCAAQITSKHRGICPTGWHIPSGAEWITLRDFVGSNAGTKLKARNGWNENGNGTDEFGFAALPGGYYYYDLIDVIYRVGDFGFWWSALERSASSALIMGMSYDDSEVYFGYEFYYGYPSKKDLNSVRCVQD